MGVGATEDQATARPSAAVAGPLALLRNTAHCLAQPLLMHVSGTCNLSASPSVDFSFASYQGRRQLHDSGT
eukprot:9055417-Alexandrium_andersonii.AAC.1